VEEQDTNQSKIKPKIHTSKNNREYIRSGNIIINNPKNIIYLPTKILEEIKTIPPEDLANILSPK